MRRRLVIVGHGMVAHKLIETLLERGAGDRWQIVVFAEEGRPAYDRVALTSLFHGHRPDELSLVVPGTLERAGVILHLGEPVTGIDTVSRTVSSSTGRVVAYDALVMATGSAPHLPPVDGAGGPGCFVYRTVEDQAAIRRWAARCRTGAVIGGGLLGLEAAEALTTLGLETHVLEYAPRLLPAQVDEEGGAVLRARIEELGVRVVTGAVATDVSRGPDGRPSGVRLGSGDEVPAELVVLATGVRPRDELARQAGLAVGPRGGVAVDEACRAGAADVYAVGECAAFDGTAYGLVGPGYEMARVVAGRLLGGDDAFGGADCSTRLKLLGVEVASFGDAFARTPGAVALTWSDPLSGVYKRLVVDGTDHQVLGGILVGDTSSYQTLLLMARGQLPTPADPAALVGPAAAPGAGPGAEALGADDLVCTCNGVTKGAVCAAVAEGGATDLPALKAATRAGTGCGGCLPLVSDLLDGQLRGAGAEVRRQLCEHFDHTRQELFDIVRVRGIRSFAELVDGHGHGRGCEICKPAVASMLASLGSGHILDGEQASLQDTNDHFLANMQRDGTYSVVPRVPGGEITPEQLIVIGQVARDFGLYTKITGAQRIDLFGAHVDQLPDIWARLIEAGFESGHAYGKALRTVKSCVGRTWCRFGVQDSTTLAIDLELRYRGLRAPHKIKGAVSGCSRECAEAQSKDFGVIATERGWNLYVCGNGGMRPQHAVLLASDLDAPTLVRYLDRYLMFYVRTAGRLERTATWLNKMDGGIEHLRRVVVEDALGLAAELEADMARHVSSYRCEWRDVVEDTDRRRLFRTFVNSPGPDPDVVRVPERAQHRPARPEERAGGRPEAVAVSVSGTRR